MNTADLARIEQTIGRSLPSELSQFYLNYPAALRSTVRRLGPDDAGQIYTECAADNELLDCPDAIIEMNDRQGGWASDLPANVFIVGSGECGETYWVDLDDASAAVHRFDAGTDVEFSDRPWASIDAFAQAMIGTYRDS